MYGCCFPACSSVSQMDPVVFPFYSMHFTENTGSLVRDKFPVEQHLWEGQIIRKCTRMHSRPISLISPHGTFCTLQDEQDMLVSISYKKHFPWLCTEPCDLYFCFFITVSPRVYPLQIRKVQTPKSVCQQRSYADKRLF